MIRLRFSLLFWANASPFAADRHAAGGTLRRVCSPGSEVHDNILGILPSDNGGLATVTHNAPSRGGFAIPVRAAGASVETAR